MRGSSEVQTGHLHPMTGTPTEVPVPRKVTVVAVVSVQDPVMRTWAAAMIVRSGGIVEGAACAGKIRKTESSGCGLADFIALGAGDGAPMGVGPTIVGNKKEAGARAVPVGPPAAMPPQ